MKKLLTCVCIVLAATLMTSGMIGCGSEPGSTITDDTEGGEPTPEMTGDQMKGGDTNADPTESTESTE